MLRGHIVKSWKRSFYGEVDHLFLVTEVNLRKATLCLAGIEDSEGTNFPIASRSFVGGNAISGRRIQKLRVVDVPSGVF